MTKKTIYILSMNHEEVKDFFTKSEQYHGFELSEHFTFDEVQKHVREKIGDAPHKGEFKKYHYTHCISTC